MTSAPIDGVAESDEIVNRICGQLDSQRDVLQHQWLESPIRHFIVDDLLPEATAHIAFESFPAAGHMLTLNSLRESRHVIDPVVVESPLLDRVARALHDPAVASLIGDLVGVDGSSVEPQPSSTSLMLMERDSFLNPHLDASHDPAESRYRIVNLFYYLTPDWRLCDGGNLELWHDGLEALPTTILSKFNRLIVLAADKNAWHSVSPVTSRRPRCSITSSYFSTRSLSGEEYFHPDTFRGRPEQKLVDLVLRAEFNARSLLRRRSQPPPEVGAVSDVDKRK